ncbi:MAG: hypothetical protein PHS60_04615 [Zavarzinia sp.]|nr:hypothetical protein [Zavarzinia sp.]
MKRLISAVAVAASLAAWTPPANAASEAECSIWLCLPGGFPLGCAAAFSAFISRVTHIPPKPPLPAWGSCAVDSGDGMGASDGIAAFVPEQRICTKTTGKNDRCIAWETIPAHYVKGSPCTRGKDNYSNPPGCTATFMYVDVFDADGNQIGDTYYWK